MMGWDTFNAGFDAWERATSQVMGAWLQSPSVLEPAGTLMTAVMKTKAMSDRWMAQWWGSIGLPTKRDQERALHALNELERRLLDLEERLEERESAG